MNCLNEHGTISEKEWEVAGLYKVISFQKIGDSSNLGKKKFTKGHYKIAEDKIINILS
jgi:hypothetical protein